MHNDVNDFPLPDSPISPRISFFLILNEIFLSKLLTFDFSPMFIQRSLISSSVSLFGLQKLFD